jgi:hypothetical protein
LRWDQRRGSLNYQSSLGRGVCMIIDFYAGLVFGGVVGFVIGSLACGFTYIEAREREDYKKINSELEWIT